MPQFENKKSSFRREHLRKNIQLIIHSVPKYSPFRPVTKPGFQKRGHETKKKFTQNTKNFEKFFFGLQTY